MSREGDLTELLSSSFYYHMSSIYTAIPCIVVTVYNTLQDQRVDVQPCINKLLLDGTESEHPPLLNVPVIFPSSKTSAFTFPINKGDTVLCVFSQRSTDVFKSSTGLPAAPIDFRKYDKRDAIAIPGLFPFQGAINNPKKRTLTHSTLDAVITHNIGTAAECEIRFKPNGDIFAKSPTKFQVDAPIINANCTTATVTASSTATVNAPTTAVNASTSTTITSPTISFIGNVSVTGNFSVASGYGSTFNGNVSFTTGTLTHAGVNISSTHIHDVSGIQTGGSTVTSAVPH